MCESDIYAYVNVGDITRSAIISNQTSNKKKKKQTKETQHSTTQGNVI